MRPPLASVQTCGCLVLRALVSSIKHSGRSGTGTPMAVSIKEKMPANRYLPPSESRMAFPRATHRVRCRGLRARAFRAVPARQAAPQRAGTAVLRLGPCEPALPQQGTQGGSSSGAGRRPRTAAFLTQKARNRAASRGPWSRAFPTEDQRHRHELWDCANRSAEKDEMMPLPCAGFAITAVQGSPPRRG